MVSSNNLKLSWNCLSKIDVKKAEPKSKPIPKGPPNASKKMVEKNKEPVNLLAANTKKNKIGKKQSKPQLIVDPAAKKIEQKNIKAHNHPQNVNNEKEIADQRRNDEERQKFIQKFGKNSSVLKFISSKSGSGVSKKTKGANVKFTVIRQQIGGDQQVRQIVRK